VSDINSLQKSSPNDDLEKKSKTFPLFAAVGNINKRVLKIIYQFKKIYMEL